MIGTQMEEGCVFRVGDVIRWKGSGILVMVVRSSVDLDGDITCYKFNTDTGLDVEDYFYIQEKDYENCILYRMETFETIKSIILEDVRW